MKKRMTWQERAEFALRFHLSSLVLLVLAAVFIAWGAGAVKGAGGPVQLGIGILCLALAIVCAAIGLWVDSHKQRHEFSAGASRNEAQK